MTSKKAILLIIILGLAVHFSSLFNGFVWDDIGQIVNNGMTQHVSNIKSFFFGLKDLDGNTVKIAAIYYRPLMASMFAIMNTIFGPQAFYFHLLSLLLHLIITVFIFKLFSDFFKIPIALALSLIFLVHPFNTEVVNYASALNDLLYFIFGIAAILLVKTKQSKPLTVISVSVLLFLSLLGKESGILFIPVILLYSFFYFREKLVSVAISSVIAPVVYYILRTSFYTNLPEDKIIGFSPFIDMSIWGHLLNIPKIFLYYFGNFFIPKDFLVAQQWVVTTPTFLDFFFPLFILLSFVGLIIFLGVKFYKNKDSKNLKDLTFFLFWFFSGIGFYFQLFPLDMTVADRWFYFGIVGLIGFVGLFADRFLVERFKIKENYILYALLALIVIFTGRTIVRSGNWSNEYNLYTHDLKAGEPSFDLENQLGDVLFNKGDLDAAKMHFQKSVDLWPCSEALNNLGLVNHMQGNIQVAESLYIKSIECNNVYKAYGNLITLLIRSEDYEKAEYYIEKALIAHPTSADFYIMAGVLQYKKGNPDKSLEYLNKAYQLRNDRTILQIIDGVKKGLPVTI